MPIVSGDDSIQLPFGVRIHELESHYDRRGSLTEIFREEWDLGVECRQWNAVTSAAGVLRGVHVHVVHTDYLMVPRGKMLLGLNDIRENSRTFGLSAVLTLSEQRLRAIVIPPGVAHGFYFPEPALHLYAVSHYWNSEDELGCHWADPGLSLGWDIQNPIVSERDADLPSLKVMLEQYRDRVETGKIPQLN